MSFTELNVKKLFRVVNLNTFFFPKSGIVLEEWPLVAEFTESHDIFRTID